MKSATKAGQIRPVESWVGKCCPGRRPGALLLLWLGMPVLVAAQAATTTRLAVTAKGLNVSSMDAGAVVTLTATVAADGKPLALGQVNFCDASAKLCSDIHLLGSASLSAG